MNTMKRAGFSLLKRDEPRPCTACGPDVSPHMETLTLVYRVDFLRVRQSICERRAFAEGLLAIERGAITDDELQEAAEVENEHMGQEIQQAHVALGEWDARATALEKRN